MIDKMSIDKAIENIRTHHCENNENCSDNCVYGECRCEYDMAIKALEFQRDYKGRFHVDIKIDDMKPFIKEKLKEIEETIIEGYEPRINKCIERVNQISDLARPVGWTQAVEVVKTMDVVDIIKQEMGVSDV